MSEHILSKDLQPAANRWKFILGELKPKGKLLTPFNIISFFDFYKACIQCHQQVPAMKPQ